MKRGLLLALGLFMVGCIGEGDETEPASATQSLTCDDCDTPPTGSDPVMLPGYQEIRPFERRCSLPVSAAKVYAVLGDIRPRGSLVKAARVQVYQGQTNLLSLPVQSGGFSVTFNTTNSPRSFPGTFVTCIKNPGANTVSIDAQATIITTN